MRTVNRRQFLAQAVGTVAIASSVSAQEKPPLAALSGSTMRPLGSTGIEVSLLGMGMGCRAWDHNSDLKRKGHDAFLSVLKRAYEKGIRYYDMADFYGAHPFVKEALQSFMDRSKVTLLTKTSSREAELVRKDVERFRQELGTDVLDVVLLHCVNDPGWPE